MASSRGRAHDAETLSLGCSGEAGIERHQRDSAGLVLGCADRRRELKGIRGPQVVHPEEPNGNLPSSVDRLDLMPSESQLIESSDRLTQL